MKEALIIMPDAGNAGESIETPRATLLAACIDHFGGATLQAGFGHWRNPAGRIVSEPVTLVTVAGDPSPANNAALVIAAAQFGRDARQEVVYVRDFVGNVSFVGREGQSNAA